MAGSESSRPCKKCKAEDAPYRLRTDPTCRDCYIQYVSLKMNKRLSTLLRDTRLSRDLAPRRYLAGLSFGPSSSVMAQRLDDTANRHANKKSSSAFDMLVVHVDTDLSYPGAQTDTPARKLLEKYRERFPLVDFECVHISDVLRVRSIDWSALPLEEGGEPVERLRRLFNKLPTVTARADILRLFIRHLLLHVTMERSYGALLLGHSTTALAALTLSEVANGRGFAIPWQVNDGICTVCTYEQESNPDGNGSTKEVGRAEFPVYYPLREVFRNEILKYIELVPSLEGLVTTEDRKSSSVVSHKDLSIEEVMARYFEGVEETYPGIVSNVVRTTGKLERVSGDGFCGSCGMTLDEQGDSRWAGEIGDDPGGDSGTRGHGYLCYGCKRSIHG
ncbi:Fc.00g076110.m01.CDS01 [Cosmosporella sp. VM-42]